MSVIPMPANSSISRRVKSEKKKFYKLNLRNLPRGITSNELQAKLAIEPAPTRFWLRPGEPFLEYDARPYAFVVFDNFEVAVKFQHQWQGKMLTADSTGEESIMLVEKALNQDWAKQGLSTPKNAKPITSHIDYIKFVEEAASRCITKQVDFDVLVNEIIERESKLAAGFLQDTPLTDYFVKRAHDKLMKGRAKGSSFKLEKPTAASKFEKSTEHKKDKFIRERPEKLTLKPQPSKPVKEKKEIRSCKPKPTATYELAVPSTASSIPETVSEKRVKGFKNRALNPVRVQQPDVEPSTQPQSEPASSKTAPTTPKAGDKETASSKSFPGTAVKKTRPSTVGTSGGRNKDRPERAIYQPGRGRRYKPSGEGRPSSTLVP